MRSLITALNDRWTADWRGPHSHTTLLPTTGHDTRSLRLELAARAAALEAALAEHPTLHAARIVVVPPDLGHGPRLLINSVADGELGTHTRRLATLLWPHLVDLLASAPASPDELAHDLRRHRSPDATLFLASPGLSLTQIRQEARLHQVLREWVAQERARGTLAALSLEEARQAARHHVLTLNDPSCARAPTPPGAGAWRKRADLLLTYLFFPILGVLAKDVWLAARQTTPGLRRGLATLLTALWALYALPFTALAMLALRIAEHLEPDPIPTPASEAKLHHLEVFEEGRTKNELTIWFPVKPTWYGRLLMRVILFGSERGTRHLWTRGTLAGAQNIHFARLLTLDGGRRMVFMSDYQGSFDAYINHFIGVGGHTRAVIPISSRVEGCPKTRWLYWPRDTVSFRQRWRAMVRSYQLQASVRFVAYPELSANDILRHHALRRDLFADHLTPEALAAWAHQI
ncbi:hypothetical protein DL240_18470 [Lujinxingia litoralis]|uniref:Uncharacterized protein n=1 Tax=Lujinxingia litoralis TaxID=2211119 RepID=A0A328C1B2_9DELT|nr:hypothetical protein [Lujinxingia litoralis]RAL20203.1 hypothetical protein DL240_18470 [Lujinxingia litoralis]